MQLPETVHSVLSRPHYDSPKSAELRGRHGLNATRCRLESPQEIEAHDPVYFAEIKTEHPRDHRSGEKGDPDDCLKAI
jgi:hypothetical protein